MLHHIIFLISYMISVFIPQMYYYLTHHIHISSYFKWLISFRLEIETEFKSSPSETNYSYRSQASALGLS